MNSRKIHLETHTAAPALECCDLSQLWIVFGQRKPHRSFGLQTGVGASTSAWALEERRSGEQRYGDNRKQAACGYDAMQRIHHSNTPSLHHSIT
ncbi:MAG: hypothetical protein QGF00_37070, partial [Planctomycetota bacterium]|nr:hypothetical protein [Planctomycetota bacterium]